MGELHFCTGRQASALGIDLMVIIIGSFLHYSQGLISTVGMFRRADQHFVRVPWHVVGNTLAVLKEKITVAVLYSNILVHTNGHLTLKVKLDEHSMKQFKKE